MKKRLMLVSLLVPLLFIVAYKALKPTLQRSSEPFIRKALSLQNFARIDFAQVEWSVLKRKISLTDLNLVPVDPKFPRLKASEISLSLSLRSLLKASLKADLQIDKLNLVVDLDSFSTDTSSSDELPLKEVFKTIEGLPVSSVLLTKANVLVQSTNNEYSVTAPALDLNVSFSKDLWIIDILEEKLQLDFFQLGAIPGKISSQAELTPTSLKVSNTNASILKAEFIGEAELSQFHQILTQPQGLFKGTLSVPLADFREQLKGYYQLPPMQGQVNAKGQFELGGQQKTTAGFLLSGTDLSVSQIAIGSLTAEGKTQGQKVLVDKLQIKNTAGLLELLNIELSWALSPLRLSIKNNIALNQINLHQLLLNLNVGDLPLTMQGQAELNCQGELVPRLNYNCKGYLNGNDISVSSDRKVSSLIVAIDSARAMGEFTVLSDRVNFDTQLKIKENSGSVKGEVHYTKGFDIDYSTERLDFKNIKYLAGLKLEGHAKLSGNTSGHSNLGLFEIEFEGKDFYIDNFYLGEPTGLMSYESSELKFNQFQAKLNNSTVAGDLIIDLKKNNLNYSFAGSRLSLKDLGTIFKRQYELPFDYDAETQLRLIGEGPFKVNEMSYDLKLNFKQLSVANEIFPSAVIQLVAQDGLAKLTQFNIAKAPFLLTGEGEIRPNWDSQLKFSGKNFLIELSENIQAINKDISGKLAFNVEMSGRLQKPQISFSSSLERFSIGSQELQNSSASGKITSQASELQFQLFGSQLSGQLRIPFAPDGSDGPMTATVTAQRWSFANLLGILGGGDLIFEYDSIASGKLDFRSESGQFKKATGQLNASQLRLSRDSQFLTNNGPLNITFNNGMISIPSFSFNGDQGSYLKLSGDNFTLDKLDLNVESLLELRIFHLFAPFLEELSGNSKLKVSVQGSLFKPEILGEAQLDNGFIKFKGLNAPLERLKAQVGFSLSKILLTDIQAFVGGGTLKGDGQVLIQGPQDLPTQLRLNIENATLNVPDKVRSTGSGELLLSGNWFPFVISGKYNVAEGLVTKEFQAAESQVSLKPSVFLPRVILESAFEPIVLDLQVVLNNPVQIKNSLINGAVTGSLAVKGPPESPGLLGKIQFAKPSQLFFRDTPFEVISGVVDFRNPREINPELNLQARTRKSNYDISLLVTGESSSPLIQVNSQPPLAEKDLISLLALGITSQNIEKESQARTEDSTSYTIGTAILANNPVAKNIQNTLGLNVQFSNEYNEIKNTSAQRVTLSRSLTERLSASASQLRGQQSSTEVKLLYSFSDSLSAVGSWESRANSESSSVEDAQRGSESILGLDLEFKREFR